jgi:hypothetical protein
MLKSKEDETGGAVARKREMRSYKILARNPERKIPLGRPRHLWEDNVKLAIKKCGVKMWTGFI